jgi:hypothetical protein
VKHLKETAIKSNEIFFNEFIPGEDVLINRDTKKRADFIIAVIGESFTICHYSQEEVEQKLMVIKATEKPIMQKSMFNESETSGDLSDPIGR